MMYKDAGMNIAAKKKIRVDFGIVSFKIMFCIITVDFNQTTMKYVIIITDNRVK